LEEVGVNLSGVDLKTILDDADESLSKEELSESGDNKDDNSTDNKDSDYEEVLPDNNNQTKKTSNKTTKKEKKELERQSKAKAGFLNVGQKQLNDPSSFESDDDDEDDDDDNNNQQGWKKYKFRNLSSRSTEKPSVQFKGNPKKDEDELLEESESEKFAKLSVDTFEVEDSEIGSPRPGQHGRGKISSKRVGDNLVSKKHLQLQQEEIEREWKTDTYVEDLDDNLVRKSMIYESFVFVCGMNANEFAGLVFRFIFRKYWQNYC